MKNKKWFLFFALSIFMISCAMSIAKNVQVFPGTPEALYGKVIVALQELGYQIKHTDAASGVILAEVSPKRAATAAALGGYVPPYQASFYVTKDETAGGAKLSITITGNDPMKGSSAEAKKLTDEILAKLKTKI
jgi:hypothetical protein